MGTAPGERRLGVQRDSSFLCQQRSLEAQGGQHLRHFHRLPASRHCRKASRDILQMPYKQWHSGDEKAACGGAADRFWQRKLRSRRCRASPLCLQTGQVAESVSVLVPRSSTQQGEAKTHVCADGDQDVHSYGNPSHRMSRCAACLALQPWW